MLISTSMLGRKVKGIQGRVSDGNAGNIGEIVNVYHHSGYVYYDILFPKFGGGYTIDAALTASSFEVQPEQK